MTESSERLKQLKDEAVDYQQTVHALLAFAALVVHDGDALREDAQFGFGRRMSTSSENKQHPNSEVTPDLVAQKSPSYGIVAEVKKSLSHEQKQWTGILGQLRKYDDDLTGWWTDDERVAHSDTILLIHLSRSRAFVNFTEEQRGHDPSVVGQTSSIVEFSESQERAPYCFFRCEYGKITDREFSTALGNGVPVPLENVIQTFSNIHYYDADPPLVVLLTNLWTEYFPSMIEDGGYDDRKKQWEMRASVSKTAEEIQRAHGSLALHKDQRAVEFPRRSRVKQAFDFLVKHKLAMPPSDDSDEYVILRRRIRGDVLEHFIKLEAGAASRKPPEGKQLALFEE
jgi:hypothetical protein